MKTHFSYYARLAFFLLYLGAAPHHLTAQTVFAVTGGGSYCSGGTGVAIGLAGSQVGISYQLKLNNVNTGTPIIGTVANAPISFGNQTAAGTYTVVATNSSNGTSTMSGSQTITVAPNPLTATLSNVATSSCVGSASLNVNASGATGIQWMNNGSPVTAVTCPSAGTYSNWTILQNAYASGDQLILTPDNYSQRGTAWYNNQIDITQSFNYQFDVNLGWDNGGADGIAFVIQTTGLNAYGAVGEGLGILGVTPSLIVEFDTYHTWFGAE